MSLRTLHTHDDEKNTDDNQEQSPWIHDGLLTVMNLVKEEQAQREKSDNPKGGGLRRVKPIHPAVSHDGSRRRDRLSVHCQSAAF